MKARLVSLAVVFLLAGATPSSAAPGLPAGHEVQTITDDLDLPVAVAWAPDGRMFIAEKDGVLKVHQGGVTSTVVDLRDQVNTFHDRGLLGIAVDKNFATNGWVYLLYTMENDPLMPDSGGATVSRLSRITVNADNTTDGLLTAILGTYTPPASDFRCPRPPSDDVDCIPADAHYHAIGTVRVDPADGTLWVGSGDATRLSFPDSHRAYDERTYAGKLLHIDTNGRGLPGHPFCPAETNTARVCTKLYAKGFRNPYRFTLRGGGKGPVVGDVGTFSYEEINLVAPGRDYGWPCYEGNFRTPHYRDSAECQPIYAGAPRTPPDLVYANGSPEGAAVVGGPIANGRVYFADYAKRWIRSAPVDSNDHVGAATDHVTSAGAPADLQTGPDGNLTYVDLGDFSPGSGAVRRVVPVAGNRAPWAEVTATPRSGAAPLQVELSSAGSGDPDGDALSYEWRFGDGETSTEANPTHTYSDIGAYTATLTVSDGERIARRPIRVAASEAPRATIADPPERFRAGEELSLATDDSGGVASGDAEYTWTFVLVHGSHRHAYAKLSGRTVGFTPATDHDAGSHYLVTLRATDPSGVWDEQTVRIDPATVRLSLASRPPGAPFIYGERDGVMPGAFDTAIGFEPWLGAAPTFARGGAVYTFESWSNGGARAQQLTVPGSDLALTARYNGRPRAVPRATVEPGGSVVFDAGASDPDGDRLTYAWNFGDGTSSGPAGPRVRHGYLARRVYRPALTVSDGRPGGVVTVRLPPVSAGGIRVEGGSPPEARVAWAVPRRGIRVTRGGRLSLRLRNRGGLAVRGGLTMDKGRALIAKRRFALAAGARRTIATRLSRRGRRLLARRGRLPVVVTVEAAADGGPPQTKRVRTRLVLRR